MEEQVTLHSTIAYARQQDAHRLCYLTPSNAFIHNKITPKKSHNFAIKTSCYGAHYRTATQISESEKK